MRDFNTWLKSFRANLYSYDYFVNFDKVFRNVDEFKVELNILNSLVGENNIESAFRKLVEEYPKVLKCIPFLLAIRYQEIQVIQAKGQDCCFDFKTCSNSIDEYCLFMRETGLFFLIQKRIINNLFDYATGVEVGLDSNGRKNRGGHIMENLVERYLIAAGFIKGETLFKEMWNREIEEKWGLDLSDISNHQKTRKRFDFVVATETCIYGIEANFYNGGGSKLNETARSFKNIALESQNIPGFSFVWFTDGKGWKSARHNLQETFEVLPHLYNLNDLENGIARKVFR